MNKTKRIPGWLTPLFWDTELEKIDLEKHYVYVIEKVLNWGDCRSLRWVFQTYERGTIRKAVTQSRGLTLKTARCWQNCLGLNEEEMRCTGQYWTPGKKPYY